MPKALEPIRRMRGGAQSCLMRCSDGFCYVVKPRDNPQAERSGRILVNEMLGTRIAARLGVPVPPCAVIEVSEELIELSPELRIQIGQHSVPWTPGPHFGSRYPGEPARTTVYDLLPDEQLSEVENLDDFLGALVVDKLACNVNGRQAIFVPAASSPGPCYRALFCDQGFLFSADAWTFRDAPLRGIYPRHRVYQGVRNLDSFAPWLARVQERLTLDALGAMASEIPLSWYDDEVLALEQLIEQLERRRSGVTRLLLDAAHSSLQPFAFWKG